MYKIKKEIHKILCNHYRNELNELETEMTNGITPDFTFSYKYILPICKTTQEWNEILKDPTNKKYTLFLNSLGEDNWQNISSHPKAISLLKNNMNKIDWFNFSMNPEALPILEKNIEKIQWNYLCWNPNPKALELIINYFYQRISYISLSFMRNNKIMYDVDYERIEKIINVYKEELLKKALHPTRIEKKCFMVDNDLDLDYFL